MTPTDFKTLLAAAGLTPRTLAEARVSRRALGSPTLTPSGTAR